MIDKDDFEQWRESAVTKWFMGKLADRAGTIKDELMTQFWGSSASTPMDWAAQQPGAAYKRGAAEALISVTVYSLEDLEPQEDK
jgi:hypothetical protein